MTAAPPSMSLASRDDNVTTQTVNVPSDSRGARALFMLMRKYWRLGTLPARHLACTTVTVIADEPVEMPLGTFDAWLVVLDEGDRQCRLRKRRRIRGQVHRRGERRGV